MATTKQIEAVTRSLREQGAGGENIARHVEALLKPEPVTRLIYLCSDIGRGERSS
jgi:hypothetical protein